MKLLVLTSSILFILSACSDGMEKQPTVKPEMTGEQTTITSEDYKGYADLLPAETAPVSRQAMKLPAGIYTFKYSYTKGTKIEHTIDFDNSKYRLQERFISDNGDSVVITEGPWAPSDGYIWLYKNQVVNGRYLWVGDTLQYFDPAGQKRYPMQKLTDISTNAVLTKKAAELKLYGLGTEPFWSVEVDRLDTIRFSMPDWQSPLAMKVGKVVQSGDSTLYSATADSLRLNVVVLPHFCSDGMSDFVYTSRVSVQYNGRTYTGCGIR